MLNIFIIGIEDIEGGCEDVLEKAKEDLSEGKLISNIFLQPKINLKKNVMRYYIQEKPNLINMLEKRKNILKI